MKKSNEKKTSEKIIYVFYFLLKFAELFVDIFELFGLKECTASLLHLEIPPS